MARRNGFMAILNHVLTYAGFVGSAWLGFAIVNSPGTLPVVPELATTATGYIFVAVGIVGAITKTMDLLS